MKSLKTLLVCAVLLFCVCLAGCSLEHGTLGGEKANSERNSTDTEGNIANTEGSIANTEGNIANTEGSIANTEGSIANTEEKIANSKEIPVKICLEQGRGFVAKSYVQTVESRTDAAFEIKLQDDYEITACSYSDYSVSESNNGYTVLTLHAVSYPERVVLSCEIPETVIIYDPNGGAFIETGDAAIESGSTYNGTGSTFSETDSKFNKTGSTEPLRIARGPSVHYRTNTLNGEEKLFRHGYVLTGWNTEADGSGEHIGLGSRITTVDGEEMKLYAEWRQETAVELFTWLVTEDGICLTGYMGRSAGSEESTGGSSSTDRTGTTDSAGNADSTGSTGGAGNIDSTGTTDRADRAGNTYSTVNTGSLVIPQEIDGLPVTEIGEGFAQNLSIETLVIPDSVLSIEDGAFRNCEIEEIYFSDTLEKVSDASFSESRPKYWHINAVMEPRYQAISDVTAFSDKMDLLQLHENEKKLILFSGCSMNYGMDSRTLQEAYPDYTVLNLGAVGGANTQFQFEIILQYIKEGDLFLHAPEQGSPYQLMSSTVCDNRMFIAVEGNFDLLSTVDMTSLGAGAFDSFRSFNEKRRSLEPCSYEDQYIPVNSYGDNDTERIASNTGRFDKEYCMHTEYLTEDSLNRLSGYYDQICQKGATVCLSYAPINELCCTWEEVAEFSEVLEQGMTARGYETISDLQDYVMEAKYFYDTDYHLTTKGALLRTELLIQDLADYIDK